MPSQLQALKAKADQARTSHAYHAEGASIRFTEAVIARMESCGITRTDLAEKIGTSPAYITKILRGDTNFTLDSMVKIAQALDCEIDFELRPLTRKVTYHTTTSARVSILNDQPK